MFLSRKLGAQSLSPQLIFLEKSTRQNRDALGQGFWQWCSWHFGPANSLLWRAVHHRMLGSIPSLYSLDASSIPSPVWQPKMSLDFVKYPLLGAGEQNSPPVENHHFRVINRNVLLADDQRRRDQAPLVWETFFLVHGNSSRGPLDLVPTCIWELLRLANQNGGPAVHWWYQPLDDSCFHAYHV